MTVAAGKSFSLSVAAFCRKANLAPSLVARQVCNGLLEDIVRMTPVDTGRARGSWTVGIYTLPAQYNTGEDKSGGDTIIRGQNTISGFDLSRGSAFIVSNLEYMPVLEYGGYPKTVKYGSRPKGLKKGENPGGFGVILSAGGFSMQAPRGMVRVSISRYQEFVRRAVREVNPA